MFFWQTHEVTRILRKTEKYRRSRRSWRWSVDHFPEMLKRAAAENPPGKNTVAVGHLRAEAYQDESYLVNAIARVPEGDAKYQAMHMHAMYLWEFGRKEDAFRKLEELVAANSNPDYRFTLALFRYREEIHDCDTEAVCHSMLEKYPGNSVALTLLAWYCMDNNEAEKALDALKQVSEAHRNYYWHGDVGTCYFMMRQFDMALSYFKGAVNRDKTRASAWAGLAGTWCELGCENKARKVMRKAFKKNPGEEFKADFFKRLGELESPRADVLRDAVPLKEEEAIQK